MRRGVYRGMRLLWVALLVGSMTVGLRGAAGGQTAGAALHVRTQYMEATLQPGMVSKTHVHSGVEVFYTESGETCLETPDGKQVGEKSVDIVIPQGTPMELTAAGTQVRRGIMLVLHNASKPSTTLVDSWKSKGLCKTSN